MAGESGGCGRGRTWALAVLVAWGCVGTGDPGTSGEVGDAQDGDPGTGRDTGTGRDARDGGRDTRETAGEEVCEAQWECGEWTDCTCALERTRECRDLARCGREEGRPVEREACERCGDGRCGCAESVATCPEDCPVDLYVEVPGGPFLQGCNGKRDPACTCVPRKPCYGEREKPQHEVTVPGFHIRKHEVTSREYLACVEAGACTEPFRNWSRWWALEHLDHPVTTVNWEQARTFCEWSGGRLCTESEWEKAARGTDGRVYPWGDEAPDCRRFRAAILEECGTSTTLPVGTSPLGASPYGVMDLAANVEEWVEDDGHDHYEGAPADGSAWVDDPRSEERVLRGGCNRMFAIETARTSSRDAIPWDFNIDDIGIRCCR